MNQIHRGMEPWDWEQPETVELRIDNDNGIQDFFSTTAQLRAEQSLHEKEQVKLTQHLKKELAEFTTREINNVEDTYSVKFQYQSISSRLPLMDDGELRAQMLEELEDRYDYFKTIITEMADTIAMYEQQKEVEAQRAREQAEKDAKAQRAQEEKNTRRNEFLQALTLVEELEYQQKNSEKLTHNAISKLPLVAGEPDQQALVNRLQAAITRISTLPTEDEWNETQAQIKAAEEEALRQSQEEAAAQQLLLQNTLRQERSKWNSLEYYGPGGRR